MELIESKKVKNILGQYPPLPQKKLKQLRALIIETARKTDGVEKLIETTKWGEPSYLTKSGSTIRIDWKEKTPDYYYVFFICSTELVNTFRIIYGDELQFESNRAIVLRLKETLPKEILKQCITLALTYQKVKHLPLLGV